MNRQVAVLPLAASAGFAREPSAVTKVLILLCYVELMGGRGSRVFQQGQRPTNRTNHGCIACNTFSLIAPIHARVILTERQE